MSAKTNLYERDFYAWTREQAELLRAGKISEADFENVAEEIESMGKTEKRELISRLTIFLLHLVKWRFQPGLRGRSWRLSIERQRLDIAALIDDNPSLEPHLIQSLGHARRRAVLEAQEETGFDASTFPLSCPWSADEVQDHDFWPE